MTLRIQPLPISVLLALTLLSSGCNSHTSQQRPLTAEEQRGRDIYQANCSICHNAYKNEPLQGPPMVGIFRKQQMPSGIPPTDEHVRTTIMAGRRNMPPFNQVLDDKQVNELLAFLHTL